VRATQDYLARLGYYGGPIDGINGPKTRAAVANYQTDSGLPPDGKVSRDLIARLAGAPSTPAQRDKVDRVAGPFYEPGDAYVYTDGQVETVLSTSESRVTWHDAKGEQWSADFDFTGRPTDQIRKRTSPRYNPLNGRSALALGPPIR
jgi:peptidoglycan hydrolase-like protein with peptidoglycan-binding domain